MFSKEELEVYIDSWAERFVNTNLCPYLTSCIKKFQDAFPEELPLQKARLGRTPFTTMGVTMNYECNVKMMTFYIQSLHGSSKVIIFSFWVILEIVLSLFSKFCCQLRLCLCKIWQGREREVGRLVFKGFSCFSDPNFETIILLQSSQLKNYTTNVRD